MADNRQRDEFPAFETRAQERYFPREEVESPEYMPVHEVSTPRSSPEYMPAQEAFTPQMQVKAESPWYMPAQDQFMARQPVESPEYMPAQSATFEPTMPREAGIPAETFSPRMGGLLGDDVTPAHVAPRIGTVQGVPADDVFPAQVSGDVTPAHVAPRIGTVQGVPAGDVFPAQTLSPQSVAAVPKEHGMPLQEGQSTPAMPLSEARTMPQSVAAVPKEHGTPLQEGLGTAGTPLTPVSDASVAKEHGMPLQEGVGTPGMDAKATPASEAGVPKQHGAALNSQPASGGGGVGQGFRVNPDQYRAAVNPIMAAMEQVSELATSLTSFLTSMESNAPWGRDEGGKKFAEGEKGYLKYSKDTQAGVKSLAGALEGVANGLKKMADGYESSEDFSTGGFSGQDGGGGGGPIGATSPPAYTPPPSHMPYNLRPTTGKH